MVMLEARLTEREAPSDGFAGLVSFISLVGGSLKTQLGEQITHELVLRGGDVTAIDGGQVVSAAKIQ